MSPGTGKSLKNFSSRLQGKFVHTPITIKQKIKKFFISLIDQTKIFWQSINVIETLLSNGSMTFSSPRIFVYHWNEVQLAVLHTNTQIVILFDYKIYTLINKILFFRVFCCCLFWWFSVGRSDDFIVGSQLFCNCNVSSGDFWT